MRRTIGAGALALAVGLGLVGVWALGSRSATGSVGAAEVETVSSGLGNPLPPKPGPESADTLEGPDVDGDGIRDDLEHAIANLWPDDPETQHVQHLGAVAMQATMLAGASGDFDAAERASQLSDVWVDCMLNIEWDRELEYLWSDKESAKLVLLVQNTEERFLAARNYEKLRDDTISMLDESRELDDCLATTFNAEDLPR
jgi:hypothetical protein